MQSSTRYIPHYSKTNPTRSSMIRERTNNTTSLRKSHRRERSNNISESGLIRRKVHLKFVVLLRTAYLPAGIFEFILIALNFSWHFLYYSLYHIINLFLYTILNTRLSHLIVSDSVLKWADIAECRTSLTIVTVTFNPPFRRTSLNRKSPDDVQTLPSTDLTKKFVGLADDKATKTIFPMK